MYKIHLPNVRRKNWRRFWEMNNLDKTKNLASQNSSNFEDSEKTNKLTQR